MRFTARALSDLGAGLLKRKKVLVVGYCFMLIFSVAVCVVVPLVPVIVMVYVAAVASVGTEMDSAVELVP